MTDSPNFIAVHTMLDPQVDSVREMVDNVAERIATLGGSPKGTPGTLVTERTWDDYSVGRKDAISYQKGCYLGQEPIVMARDRGVVQRTLVGLLVGDAAAPRGALLFREGKEVGRVTSSVCSPRLRGEPLLTPERSAGYRPGTAGHGPDPAGYWCVRW